MAAETPRRRRLEVRGVVQGVGYRPFVLRLGRSLGVAGFVRNTGHGVTIEIEGAVDVLGTFEARLAAGGPPLARVSTIEAGDVAPTGEQGFEIRSSARAGKHAWIPPDTAPCDACLTELRGSDPRRARHAFISCTGCGPRYTIATATPFDRVVTTMAPFPLCQACAVEYETPGDRRCHAQTIACTSCGPRVTARTPGQSAGRPPAVDAPIDDAVAVLRNGGVLAVKGVGVYQLVCDATRHDAVAELRRRKARPEKPLAVLVADLDDARRVVELSREGAAALAAPTRPIVVAPARHSRIVGAVTRGVDRLGVMLPPSPLHVLLADAWRRDRVEGAVAALVVTSANASDLPALIDDAAAGQALAGIADRILTHDRPIAARADDSVVLDAAGAIIPVRLGRGCCPAPLALPVEAPPLLAVGGEFKAACCLAFGHQAVMAPHVGDMGSTEALDAMSDTVHHLCGLLAVEPEIFVCDAHPGYLSSRWADEAAGGRAERVQHHHAHAASLMAEHSWPADARLLAVCLDGTGYGDDGAIWGGEVLDAGYRDAIRLAHLSYAPLPGGDAAIRHPARTAYCYLRASGIADVDALPFAAALGDGERRVLSRLSLGDAGTVRTSSMGRLFDVVAAVCGVAAVSAYEGHAAMLLEAQAVRAGTAGGGLDRYAFETGATNGGPVRIEWAPVLAAIVDDVRRQVPVPVIAAAFHDAVARMIRDAVVSVAGGREVVGLTGGVFQNAVLLQAATRHLRAAGIAALTHRRVPPNDGGLSLGQAAVAAVRRAGMETR